MTLASIIPESTLCIIATVTGEESLDKAKYFLDANEEVLRQFESIQLHYNWVANTSIHTIANYKNTWERLDNLISYMYHFNAGHMWGTIDLDEACFRHCQTKYLWKSTEDVLLLPQLLEKEVEDVPFYFLPGFSYETLCNAGSVDHLLEMYESNFFSPQTNFFILERDEVTSLYGDMVEEKRLAYLQMKERYPSLKPWEMNFPDGIKLGCEDLLGDTVKGLSKQCLLSPEEFRDLANFVKINRWGNPSHPNILLEEIGVCHLHDYKSGVYKL